MWFCEARRNSLGLSSPAAPLLTLHGLLMTAVTTWWWLVRPQRSGRVTARLCRGLLQFGCGDTQHSNETTKEKKNEKIGLEVNEVSEAHGQFWS